VIRVFHLERDLDLSGVSGVGVVAEGVEFTDGVVVLRWRSGTATTAVHANLASVQEIHGHGGATRIVFEDQQ